MRCPAALVPMLILPFSACSSSHRATLATAKIDTLPNGAISVTSPGPTRWADSASAWRIVPAGTISGESGTPGELINPGSIAVDDAGRIYVSDSKPTVVKVFSREGRFLHTIGREGEGPGEFKTGFLATHGRYLVLHDPQLSRTTVFDTSGALVRSWKTSCCYYGSIGTDTAGRIAILTMTTPEQKRAMNFTRWTLGGTFVDTLIVPEAGEPKYWTVRQGRNSMMSTGVPAAPRTVAALDPFGGVLYGYSADYRIAVSATGRDTAQIFGRAWTPAPVSSDWKHARVEGMITSNARYWPEASLRQAFREADVPGTFPAFESIGVDPAGNRWVRLASADTTSTRFDVFDRGGSFLGGVSLAQTIPEYGLVWTRDELYALTESDDGTPAVLRFRVEKKGTR